MKWREDPQPPQGRHRAFRGNRRTVVDVELGLEQVVPVGMKDSGPECRYFSLIAVAPEDPAAECRSSPR